MLTDALVRSVLVDQNGMATGVAYVDRKTRKDVEAFGRVVVLAASCVETAHIMLNSRSRHWPTGIANSSGQLGRNLWTHLYGGPGYGYLPQLVGQRPTPDNIADSTVAWMPRWRNSRTRVRNGSSVAIQSTWAEAAANSRVTIGTSRGLAAISSATSSGPPLRNRRADPGAVTAQRHQLRRYRSG